MKIDELGLSARAYHVLKEARIDTVEQLREALSNPFVKIGSIGSSMFNEIQSKFAAHPITNGERIRAMSDEELSKIMSVGCCGGKNGYCIENEYGEANCIDCWIKWLKQPAKENT